ncbi:MAG: multidrug transporter [Rhodospirillales bacterium]|jgi:multidrug efflux system membrane fusion protein|nr:multidrug transporter [Rhodospirillales bacterium]
MDDLKSDREIPLRRPLRAPQPPPRRRIWGRLVWLLIGLAVIGAVAWVIFRPHAAPRSQTGRFSTDQPMPVATATAETGDLPIMLNALGTVTPLATVTVRTQISGQLMQIAFSEGQTVAKGDFLAQIDPRPYQNALDQAQGQLVHDQALLDNANVDLTRYRRLVSQDSIARQQLDTQIGLVHQYEGTVKTDQAMVSNAQLNLAYCRIVAPVSGRVGLRQVDTGNYVQTADTNGIVVITQLKPISVIFTLPEDSLPAVLKRVHASATLPVTIYDRTQSVKLATGALATVDNQIDTTTGTVKLRAQFDNDDESLFPNQFVNTELLVQTLHGATVVPTAAIQRGAPGTYVYLVGPDLTVSVRPVKLGPADGERVAIQEGLAPGDKVVTDGADRLRDGAKVTIPDADAAQKPAPRKPGARGQNRQGASRPAQ